MNLKQTTKAVIAVSFCALSMGCSCAKIEDVDHLRHEVRVLSEKVNQTSAEASQAKFLADEANSRSKQTEEALNRGFKKSMRK